MAKMTENLLGVKREWVRGLVLCVKIKCAEIVAGERRAFRLPARDGQPLEFVALNACDQFGQSYDLEVCDRFPFETGVVRDRAQGGIEVAFVPPKIDEWIILSNASMSKDVDSYGKKKIKVDSVFQIAREDLSATAAKVKPTAARRVRAAT